MTTPSRPIPLCSTNDSVSTRWGRAGAVSRFLLPFPTSATSRAGRG
jgi:hypothetical protein